jgi:hypothetical protein|tara:strand:+ start:787 stop:1050 length:264 start_codon:yes stop_codon:yes gene_type:complete
MVASSNIEGSEEKSRGLVLLIAIIMITRPTTILKVNKKPSINTGSGRINIKIISKTRKGKLNPENSIFEMSRRRFDSDAIAIYLKLN